MKLTIRYIIIKIKEFLAFLNLIKSNIVNFILTQSKVTNFTNISIYFWKFLNIIIVFFKSSYKFIKKLFNYLKNKYKYFIEKYYNFKKKRYIKTWRNKIVDDIFYYFRYKHPYIFSIYYSYNAVKSELKRDRKYFKYFYKYDRLMRVSILEVFVIYFLFYLLKWWLLYFLILPHILYYIRVFIYTLFWSWFQILAENSKFWADVLKYYMKIFLTLGWFLSYCWNLFFFLWRTFFRIISIYNFIYIIYYIFLRPLLIMIIYILLFLWKIIDNIFNIYYYPGYERKFINFLLNIDNGVVQAQITFWQKVADFKVWRKLWWIRQKQNWKDFTWFCWYWYYEILIMYCKFRKQLAIMYFNNLTDIEIWNHKRVWRNYMKFRERQLFYIQLRCLIGIYFYGVILRNRNWEFQVHLMFLYFLVDKLYVFYYFFFLRFTFRLAWRYEVKPLIRLYSSYIYCDILLTWECLIKLELPYWYLYLKYCIKSKWINFKRFKVVYKIWIYCGYFRFKIHKRYTIIALKIFIYISCRILLNVLDIITLGSLTKIKLKLLDFFWVKIKKNQWDLILQNYYKKNSEKIYKRGEEERKQFLNVMAKYREELYILRKRDIIKEIVEEDLEKKNQKK